jgi:hypothetical protein
MMLRSASAIARRLPVSSGSSRTITRSIGASIKDDIVPTPQEYTTQRTLSTAPQKGTEFIFSRLGDTRYVVLVVLILDTSQYILLCIHFCSVKSRRLLPSFNKNAGMATFQLDVDVKLSSN